VRVLGLSLLSLSMLYTLIGHLGILFFFHFFKRNIKNELKYKGIALSSLVFFLPSLHFWSASVGKDTLVFMGIGMFVWAVQDPFRYKKLLLLSLLVTYLIRPHITLMLIVAFLIAVLLGSKFNKPQKIRIGLLSALLIGFVGYGLIGFFANDTADKESIAAFAKSKSEKLSATNVSSRIDANSTYPYRVFSFLYRPLFFDAKGLLALIVSLENAMLLLLSLFALYLNPVKQFFRAGHMYRGMLFFFLMGTISFAYILGNLGIMLRQRNMFLPALLFVCLMGISTKIEKLNRFCRQTTDSRNYYTHYDSKKKKKALTGRELSEITRINRAIVISCLLN
ncbi:MAG: HEPN domain-containing protein, partial [Marinirhabdus sp.]